MITGNHTIHCDRCDKLVEGGVEETFSYGVYFVAGTQWEKFANPNEQIVCDACMWADPRYIQVYGVIGKDNQWQTNR